VGQCAPTRFHIPKRHLIVAHNRDRQTDRQTDSQTDHATLSV